MPLDVRASRPCCRERRRPARGTNSSWALAAVHNRRDSTHSRGARLGIRRRRSRSRCSAPAQSPAIAVAKVPAAIRAVRVFVIGVSLERRLDFRTGQVWSFTAAVHRARRSRRLPVMAPIRSAANVDPWTNINCHIDFATGFRGGSCLRRAASAHFDVFLQHVR